MSAPTPIAMLLAELLTVSDASNAGAESTISDLVRDLELVMRPPNLFSADDAMSIAGLRRTASVAPAVITYVVIARDASRIISRCLASIPHESPVLLLDTGSTDGTVEAARATRPELEIYETAWEDSFAIARNSALDLAGRNTWVCFIDADEYLTPGHSERLQRAANLLDQHPDRARIGIEVAILDSVYGRLAPLARMFRVDGELRFEGRVHESVVARTGQPLFVAVDVTLLHDGYEEAIADQRRKELRNERLLAIDDCTSARANILEYYKGRSAAIRDVNEAEHILLRALDPNLSEQGTLPEGHRARALLMVMQLALARDDAVAAAAYFERFASESILNLELHALYSHARHSSITSELNELARGLAVAVARASARGGYVDPGIEARSLGLLAAIELSAGEYERAAELAMETPQSDDDRFSYHNEQFRRLFKAIESLKESAARHANSSP